MSSYNPPIPNPPTYEVFNSLEFDTGDFPITLAYVNANFVHKIGDVMSGPLYVPSLGIGSGFFQINSISVTSSATQLNYCNVTPGIASASKALVLDSSLNVSGINDLTSTSLTGTLLTASQTNITAIGTLTNLTVSNTITLTSNSDSIKLTGSGGDINLNATSTSLLLSGTASNITFQSGKSQFLTMAHGTLIIDSVTVNTTGTELNYINGITLGSASASKVLSVDSSRNLTGINTLTLNNGVDTPLIIQSSYIAADYQQISFKGDLFPITNPNYFWNIGTYNSSNSNGNKFFIYSGTVGINAMLLDQSGNMVLAGNLDCNTLNATTLNITTISATNISGTLTTASQPNITSLGTLSTLNVNGQITNTYASSQGVIVKNTNASSFATIAYTNDNRTIECGIAGSSTGGLANKMYWYSAGTLMTLDTSSNLASLNSVSATTLTGTLSTAAQTNITSLGTLTGLNCSGVYNNTNSTNCTSSSTGCEILSGGLYVAKNIYTSGNIALFNSSSPNTLYLDNGLGNYIASTATSSGDINITSSLANINLNPNTTVSIKNTSLTNAYLFKVNAGNSMNMNFFNPSSNTSMVTLCLGTSTDINANRFISALNSNFANNSSCYFALGAAAATNNQGEIAFSYTSSGSTSNFIALGVYGTQVIKCSQQLMECTTAAQFDNIIRVQGSGSPVSGTSLELQWNGTAGLIAAYDRTGSAYKDLSIAQYLYIKASNGYIGVNQTSPIYPLDINLDSSHTVSGYGYLNSSSSGSNTGYASGSFTHNFSCRLSSGILLSTSEFNVLSDIRNKTNINDITIDYARSIIENVKPKTFNYKNNLSNLKVGYIAQDLAKVDEYNLHVRGINNLDNENLVEMIDEDDFKCDAGVELHVNEMSMIPIIHKYILYLNDQFNNITTSATAVASIEERLTNIETLFKSITNLLDFRIKSIEEYMISKSKVFKSKLQNASHN